MPRFFYGHSYETDNGLRKKKFIPLLSFEEYGMEHSKTAFSFVFTLTLHYICKK